MSYDPRNALQFAFPLISRQSARSKLLEIPLRVHFGRLAKPVTLDAPIEAMVERGGPPHEDPAQHGSAYDYDRRVPIIFWGPWLGEHRMDPASTVDIAPTLAKELGIEPEERLDGVPLKLSGSHH